MKKYALNFIALIACLLVLSVQPAYCDVTLPKLISDGMVLQRNIKANIWGWAEPDETVTIEFKNKTYHTSAGQDRKWEIKLPKTKSGGPYRMEIIAGNRISLNNIYIGDVWIGSGQSNMGLPIDRVRELYEHEIADSDNPEIRYFAVPERYDFKNPQDDLPAGQWRAANPESLPGFSAVGYFFAREINRETGIPIGLINASLGGSPVEAWLSEEALQDFPRHLETAIKFKDDALIQKIIDHDKAISDAWYGHLNARDKGLAPGQLSWADPAYDASDWPVMNLPAFWDESELGGINGAVWFRKEIILPGSVAGKPARLLMGRIVDSDTTYINGKVVGTVSYQYPPRRYQVPENVLQAGKNIVAIRVINNAGRGGFIKGKPYRLITDEGEIELSGEWRYRLGTTMGPLEEQTFIRWKPLGLYNAMIAPLTDYAVKGVIWYQGESNTGNPVEYGQTFPALIKDWRTKWKQGDFSFLYVQLPNFMEAREQPGESQWAELREAQLKSLRVPKTAMAVAIDIGEWNDIHPLNKKDVGKRLALAALKVAYGKKNLVHSGPIYRSMRIKNDKVILSFANTGSGLVTKGNGKPGGFAVCGADGRFVWANAKIRDNKVVVWHDDISQPKAVRYAWADNPENANLYNKEGLPASPFRTDSN